MLISYFSIFFIYNLIFLRKKNLNFFNEDIHLFLYFLILASIFFILTIIPVLTAAILSGVFFMNREDSSLGIAFIILIIMYSCFNVFISVVYREFRDEWQVTSSVGTES